MLEYSTGFQAFFFDTKFKWVNNVEVQWEFNLIMCMCILHQMFIQMYSKI